MACVLRVKCLCPMIKHNPSNLDVLTKDKNMTPRKKLAWSCWEDAQIPPSTTPVTPHHVLCTA